MTCLGEICGNLPIREHSFPFVEAWIPDEEDVPITYVAMQDRNLHCSTMGYVLCQRCHSTRRKDGIHTDYTAFQRIKELLAVVERVKRLPDLADCDAIVHATGECLVIC